MKMSWETIVKPGLFKDMEFIYTCSYYSLA
jgi:hypothetical protein